MIPARPLHLRAAARRRLVRFSASIESAASGAIDAVVAGRALVTVAGFAVAVFSPLLAPTGEAWMSLAVVSACMTVALAVSYVIAWDRLPAWSTVSFPFLVCSALAVLGLTAHGFAAPLTGVLTLCFAFVGLTQRPGTAVYGLPVAAVTLLCAYDTVTPQIIVRLFIALFVWTMLAELLARLTRRQFVLTASLAGAAHHDHLTGLSNRRDLQLRLADAGSGDTLVMCDLDHFKQVNDQLGHAEGDRILADFGALLRIGLREGDYCARFGGEEFLLLLPATSSGQARNLLERLRAHWATMRPGTTFSAGAATCAPGRSIADTLAAADELLYAAKAGGRDRVVTESDPRPSTLAEPVVLSAS